MISIVIPVFNEEKNLEVLNKRLSIVCKTFDTNFEIIYVDDGSSDKSLDIIKNRYLSENKVTLEHLAHKYNVSIERIRQIEQKSLDTLKTNLMLA